MSKLDRILWYVWLGVSFTLGFDVWMIKAFVQSFVVWP